MYKFKIGDKVRLIGTRGTLTISSNKFKYKGVYYFKLKELDYTVKAKHLTCNIDPFNHNKNDKKRTK